MNAVEIKQRNLERAQLLREKNPFILTNELVYQLMLEDIVACRLEPGEKLREEQCAELYGCSRSTIRKIFNRLVDEDWLDRSESHRIRIREISLESHMETMEFRLAVEPAAARLAARCRTREKLKTIEQCVRQCDTTDVYQLYVSDLEFHRAVLNAGRNRYLISAYKLVDLHMSRAKLYAAADFEDVCKECYQEHLQIYEAIKARDEAAAYRLAKQHIKMMLDAKV